MSVLAILLLAWAGGPEPERGALLSRVDHLVYAAPDLDAAIDALEKRLGVRATPGGSHPGRGTRNALIALGPASYLEIIAPDPLQPRPSEPPPFGVGESKMPRLVAWAAKGSDLERFAADARRGGVSVGPVRDGSRRRTDGILLAWKTVDVTAPGAEGIAPFFIDWGESPHPAKTAAPGLVLERLRAEHPDPKPIREVLERLGLDLPVSSGPAPILIATISTAHGPVELR